ncbi:uncharacterized protein LOC108090488 [Drosophila ficusphila]|uniref:uncharacterized protein LOC108090488 n=1 Tax=Drosophila ficusphila TaxID=30025 RepID=UPI0007E603AA|nr:uncharacterized protein LOC108090488 [Drosophila ficusphila]
MTSFNASSALLPLDEYYEQCVVPKPVVPARYSSNPIPYKAKRQAGRLRSYKEQGQEDDDNNDDEDEDFKGIEEKRFCQEKSTEGFDTTLSFELNDFNQIYGEEEASSNSELPRTSAQWRIYGNNMNRPPGAAPFVPNTSTRGNVKSRLDLRSGSRFQNNKNQRQYNNNFENRNNFYRGQQHAQNAIEQRMRTSYNAFGNQASQGNQSTDVLMNLNNNFQYSHQDPSDLLSNTNVMGIDQQDFASSSTITSLINSVSNIPENRVKNRFPCETVLHTPTSSVNDTFARRAHDFPFPVPDLDDANTPESVKVSKIAKNVLLLLMGVAQKNGQGPSSDLSQNIDWMNGLAEKPQSDAMPGLDGHF